MIDRDGIAALIPHAGRMCLLDRVEHWDAASIRCTASSHRDPTNPLAVGGKLGAACGVEYAAQAMAIHGGLTGAAGKPRAGYLVSLRGLELTVARLDDLDGDLIVEAELQAEAGSQVSYRFTVGCGDAIILSGRASVMLDAGEA
ncbi:MAG TPA: hypothetical protein VM689_17255 [Aliidongia sp.]|nr:hypothetical protein [Aliidongia sp.]